MQRYCCGIGSDHDTELCKDSFCMILFSYRFICVIICTSFLVGFNPKALENCGPALLQRGVHSFDRLNLWAQSSKIAREKLMNQRLYSYLERYDILYSLQFGFREKCSTSHALVSITEQIRRSIDNNEYGCGVFIDLKKAFTTQLITLFCLIESNMLLLMVTLLLHCQ